MLQHNGKDNSKAPLRTSDDIEAGRFLDNIKSIKPSSDFSYQPQKPVSPSGIPGDNLDNGYSGGSGGKGGDFSDGGSHRPSRRNPLLWIVLLGIFLLLVSLAFSLVNSNSKKVEVVEVSSKQVTVLQKESQIALSKAQLELESARLAVEKARVDQLSALKAQLESFVIQQNAGLLLGKAETKQKEIINTQKSFNCGTDAERDDGFSSDENVEYVNADSQSLRMGPRCLKLIVNGKVDSVDAKNYMLAVDVTPDPKNTPFSERVYMKCGTIGGRNDSSCTNFVNQWSGRRMNVIVMDDGFVNFN